MKFPSMRTAPAASLGQPRTTHRACRSGPFCRFGAYGKKRAKLLLRVHNLIHLTQGRCMAEKQLAWAGSSYKDLTDDDTFPMEARKVAGQQLRKIQRGDEPDDWKPFEEIGAGTKEIRIKLPDGAFRVMYVAKFPEAVYVLHCFKKKTQRTSQQDKDLAKQRYKLVIQERSKP